MKYLRAIVRAEPEHSPLLFRLLAHSPSVDEARVLEQTTSPDGFESVLVALDGDVDAFTARAASHEAVESVATSRFEGDDAAVLIVLRPAGSPGIGIDRCTTGFSGVIVRLPLVFRDGAMRARVVGNPDELQQTVDGEPRGMDVTIEEIGPFRASMDSTVAALSPRQRAALETAAELGYYEQPRRATHEDIADRLDCAPQTVSDHLQKAEANVIETALDQYGSLR